MKCGDACDNLPGYQYVTQYTIRVTPNEPVSFTLLVNPMAHRFIASFRGTETKTQLLKEFFNSKAVEYNLHPIKNAVATQYFYEKYVYYLRSALLRHIKEATQKYPNFDFFFVGHSLGGAFATLASLDVALSNYVDRDRLHLYTYGSPRVGDYNLAQKVVDSVGEIYRMTHRRDTVPHLPPCVSNLKGGCAAWPEHINEGGYLAFNAYHVWPEVFHVDDNPYNYKICTQPEDPTCANQYYIAMSVNDHVNYLGISTRCMINGVVDQ